MNKSNHKKSSAEIAEDLKNISPLALPQYLKECEYYDMESSKAVLDRVIAEFEEHGGVAGNMTEIVLIASVEGAVFGCVEKWGSVNLKETINRERLSKKNISIQSIIKQCLNFQYPENTNTHPDFNRLAGAREYEFASNPEAINITREDYELERFADDELSNRQNQERQKEDGNSNSGNAGAREYEFASNPEAINITRDKYSRERLADDKWAKLREQQWQKENGNSNCGNDGYGGKGKIRIDHADAENDGRIKDDYRHQAELDHIVPLKQIHKKFSQYDHYTERYLSKDACKAIANHSENLVFTNKRFNRIKNDGTNEEFINSCDQKCKKIKAELQNPNLTSERRLALEKKLKNYTLTTDEKNVLLKRQKQAEMDVNKNMLIGGTSEVLLEQIGKIVETIIGPVSFEIRDMMKNGINHHLGTSSYITALGHRLTRAFKYIATQLPRLLGEFFKDIGQMLLTFIEGFLSKICKIFSSIIKIITRGFTLIIEAIKIFSDKAASPAEKGNAIMSLILSFATGILGNYVIDYALEYLGLPDPFSNILAAIASAIISAVVMYIFNELDFFNIKRELRLQRVKEVFDLRLEELERDSAAFDLMASEKMKANRLYMEELRISLDKAITGKDFSGLNQSIDKLCDFLKVDVPYSNSREFIEYVRQNSKIRIGC